MTNPFETNNMSPENQGLPGAQGALGGAPYPAPGAQAAGNERYYEQEFEPDYGPEFRQDEPAGTAQSPQVSGALDYAQNPPQGGEAFPVGNAEEGAAPDWAPEPPRKNRRGAFVALVAAVSLFFGGAGAYIGNSLANSKFARSEASARRVSQERETGTESADQSTAAPSGGESSSTAAAPSALSTPEIVEAAAPATVAIYADKTVRNMFGQTLYGQGSGSGVIISEDGYIVTNNHVVGNSSKIKVTLANGDEYRAELVGTNEIADIAVIKIEAETTLPYLKFGSSDELRVGETVIAIGNPLGELEGTVSQGIISALNRDVIIEGQEMQNLIQIDAPINSGNSGGALLNGRGELIGINVAKTDGDNVEGIAFAIPSDAVQAAAQDIINGVTTVRPVMGVRVSTVSAAMQSEYQVPAGVWVQEVIAASPAEAAGLQAQDVIVEANGVAIASVAELNRVKNQLRVGDELKLKVYRAGATIELSLTLGADSE